MSVQFYKLIHELQVHQIELEIQNVELILAQEQALKTTDKYPELYDYAPSGIEAGGCTDYISKPIRRDYLMALLQKYFPKTPSY